MRMVLIIWVLWAIYNVGVFLLYGVDRLCRIVFGRHMPTELLLLPSCVMGALGGKIGMIVFGRGSHRYSLPMILEAALAINLLLMVAASVYLYR